MKKLKVFFTVLLCAGLFTSSASASSETDLTNKLSRSIAESMKGRGMDVNVKIDVLKKMGTPAGYYFLKLTFYDKKKPDTVAGEQFVFSDGDFIVQDFLRASDMGSIAKDLSYEFSVKEIDVTGLTPIMGKAGAKNVIVEVSDFQCPFCIKANEYLHSKLKNRRDVVVYMMHFPLRNMHPKAELLAKIFEAGAMMGKNFGNELYESVNHKMSDAQLLDKYAARSGDAVKFKQLVASKEVADKVLVAEERAKDLGVSSTPTLFINGKTISGFDVPLMEKAISEFK